MKDQIILALKPILESKGVKLGKQELDRFIEIPPSYEMGDYAFPCFFLSKKLRKNPKDIAIEISSKIKSNKFDKVQVYGPYINFFINRKKFAKETISEILKAKDKYGSVNIGNGKKALIEHTSINPNASPHVGRARNAIIGDSIVRILRFLGFKPEVHYYVNDVSKQIAMLVLAKAENKKFQDMLKKYIEISKKVSDSKIMEQKVFSLLNKFEKGDKATVKSFKKITDTCVEGQEKILSQLGIKYDYFDYESKYLKDAKKTLSDLKKTGKLFTDKDNRSVLDLKNTAIENQMKSPVLVVTRSDSTGLYPLRDISYTIEKMKKAEKNILVLGEDQKLYFQQIKQALKFLGKKSPEVVHYSFILLTEKNIKKKMSTRKGDVVLLEDFLKDAISKAEKSIKLRKTKGDSKKVGIGAVKYSILRNNNNKIIHFDLDEALTFEGDTGPYLLYSYARASSILRKAKGVKGKQDIKKLELKEIELVKKLSQFPDIIKASYNTLNPALIANYSYQLAQVFNEFYHACPVITSDQKEFRLSLVKSFRQVLKNSLGLLGIEVMEEM